MTGVPAEAIRELAHMLGRADRAQICWTLGITEHHNAVDNVFALINLACSTGTSAATARASSRCAARTTCRAAATWARSEQAPGLPGVEDDALRAHFDAAWGATVPPKRGLHLSDMFEAMEHGTLHALYVIGENPAQSEADQGRAIAAPRRASTHSSCRTSS